MIWFDTMGANVARAHQIKSVSDFVKHVLEWRENELSPVAFRGQKYTDWKTIPKLFREDVGLYEHEKTAVRDLFSVHPQEFHSDETMFDRLVRMQHYGLPTRLLDVTINPLVALYFACEDHIIDKIPQDGKVQAIFTSEAQMRYYDSDQVSCLANLANLTLAEKDELFSAAKTMEIEEFNNAPIVQRLIWFVRIEKPHFLPKINPEHLLSLVFVKPKMSNRRIIAQSGAFLIYGIRQDARYDSRIRARRAIVPAARKSNLRQELEFLGVHAGTIFPELDKAAGYITERYSRLSVQ